MGGVCHSEPFGFAQDRLRESPSGVKNLSSKGRERFFATLRSE